MAINLSTESLARASSRRPWMTVGIWVALLTFTMYLNITLLGSATTTEFRFTNDADSQHAFDVLEERLRGPRPMTEMVIVQSEALTVDDPAFQDKVEAVYGAIIELGDSVIARGTNYYQENDESLVSSDRKTTIMPLVMTGTVDEAPENVEDVLHIIAEASQADGFRVLMAGEASIAFESNELATADIEKACRMLRSTTTDQDNQTGTQCHHKGEVRP